MSETEKICPIMTKPVGTDGIIRIEWVQCQQDECALWIPKTKIADGPAGALFRAGRCGLKITKGE